MEKLKRTYKITATTNTNFLGKFSSGQKSRSLFGWRGPHSGSLNPALSTSMASYTGVLKDYGHISLNEAFKSQNNVNFKLIKTVLKLSPKNYALSKSALQAGLG
uniref:Uncharacterized protein n=1 Tax=Glossina austeni TaxID=7395 RepID=A0A1A9UW87_GLOAU